MKLIVCSNNIDFLNKLDSSFDLKDFQIIIAKSIDKIISSLSHKCIIIMDHINDDFDAIEASNIIRETNTLTYIIIRSNSNENFLKIAAYNNGCNDFVSFNLSAHILFKKIKTIVNPALDTLNELKKENLIFDIIFIDADKENYKYYYNKSFDLLKRGGLMIIDNVLWHGEVADEKNNEKFTNIIRDFNTFVKNDERTEQIILPLGDGLTICNKL